MARKIYEPEIPGIYGIRNINTDIIYIGKSSRIGRRWDWHLNQLRKGNHFNTHLQASWLKHGERNFVFEIIEDLSNCDKLEQKYELNMAEAKALIIFEGKNYNFTIGGDGGVVPGPLTKLKMGVAQKKRFTNNPDGRQKQSEVMLNNLNRNNGELRDIISEAAKKFNAKRWADPENHRKQSQRSTETQSSPEYKARHSKIIGESWQDEEIKASRLKGIQSAWDDPVKRAVRMEKTRITRERNRRLRNVEQDNSTDT